MKNKGRKNKVRKDKRRQRRLWSAQLNALRALRVRMGNTYLSLKRQGLASGDWPQFLDQLSHRFEFLRASQAPMSSENWMALMLRAQKFSAEVWEQIQEIFEQEELLAQLEDDAEDELFAQKHPA